jgi:hypothetical protein
MDRILGCGPAGVSSVFRDVGLGLPARDVLVSDRDTRFKSHH